MFNDEEAIAFRKMQGFSVVDGFAEVTENMADMIKSVTNEPSVGLFYVQQHIQNAAPNLVNLKNKIVEKSDNTAIRMQDLEDSIAMVKSMKECGLPIADEMIRDIKRSLSVIASNQRKRPSSSFLGRSSSFFSPSSWRRNVTDIQQKEEKSSGYFSTVLFKPSKHRSDEANQMPNEAHLVQSSMATASKLEPEELPLSIEVPEVEESHLESSLSGKELLSLCTSYDEFKADKEAQLEEWLGSTGTS